MRPHPPVEITEALKAAGRDQAFRQVQRRQPSVHGGEATLLTGSNESIGQVSQVNLPIPREGLVEHGDSIVEQRRRSTRLTQPQQTVARLGRGHRWSHPVQPAWIAIRLELLDLHTRLGNGRHARRFVLQGGQGSGLSDGQLGQQPGRLPTADPGHGGLNERDSLSGPTVKVCLIGHASEDVGAQWPVVSTVCRTQGGDVVA
ncbi:MAG: hypothetical protein ACRDQ0_09315, partial [Pseudonocardia sp.]